MKLPEDVYSRKGWTDMSPKEQSFFQKVKDKQYPYIINGFKKIHYCTGTNEEMMEWLNVSRSHFFEVVAALKLRKRLEVIDLITKRKKGVKEWRLIIFWDEKELEKKEKFGNEAVKFGESKQLNKEVENESE
jgi:hypothetical protein